MPTRLPARDHGDSNRTLEERRHEAGTVLVRDFGMGAFLPGPVEQPMHVVNGNCCSFW